MFKNILVAIDLEDEASWLKALTAALEIARASGGRVHLISVVPDFGLSVVSQYFPDGTEEKILKETSQALHAFAEEHVDEELRDTCVIGNGTVYQEILNGAERIGANLIVMGSHRPSMRDYLLGPNASRVVRHAQVSVLVVRD